MLMLTSSLAALSNSESHVNRCYKRLCCCGIGIREDWVREHLSS